MVTVISGANEANAELAGQTVGQVRESFAGPLNIAAGARATVNGLTADEGTILRDGDQVNFTKQTAEKG